MSKKRKKRETHKEWCAKFTPQQMADLRFHGEVMTKLIEAKKSGTAEDIASWSMAEEVVGRQMAMNRPDLGEAWWDEVRAENKARKGLTELEHLSFM